MTLDEILKEIKNAKSIVILTHETPDGDAIGSSMALKLMIEEAGKDYRKEADVIIPEYSRTFNFLPEYETIKKDSEIKKYDLAIAVDCAEKKRIAKMEYFDNANKTISIDHHGSNTMFADLNYVNPASPACCEILAGIIKYYDVKITKKIGTCLMTGIITDTGGFRHQGINADTFEFVADLINIGVNLPDIYKKSLCTKTRASFELEKRAINRLELLGNEKIAFTYIKQEDMLETNAQVGDHEGIVNIGLTIEGTELSVFLRQVAGENIYKASLRSSGDVNVSDVCLLFGGGGHPRAAGATIQGNLSQVKEKIIKELEKSLEKLQ